MINKDYILRLAEQIGYELSILIGLRKRNRFQDELIAIDNLLLKYTGLTSRFINSLADELLLQSLSPLGKLNVDSALWIASMLKEEGAAYEGLANSNESYYRYTKSLYLLLELLFQEHVGSDSPLYNEAEELIHKLADYALPAHIQQKLFRYYEQRGMYAQAENFLFDLLEQHPSPETLQAGQEFYQRLQKKSTTDLQLGDFSHEEVQEGLDQLQRFR
ncbi:DUF6483 family protein [Dictyobacter aurantiacus]|uniref:Bacterial transcriptional activator domain-containing protein n=1 Tax=Dictyobacter aurantiacus TaxID=1936993 RepID=A0A401Z9W4_9CHLR|nr:DUF6483 family protein [Dictyobacter aurantiacus]GCE03670.1 hypothetical protein KDAU_09990 [Dictyobacter aurantiacus]